MTSFRTKLLCKIKKIRFFAREKVDKENGGLEHMGCLESIAAVSCRVSVSSTAIGSARFFSDIA
jgi:hypothetical protein